jgi:hypothetical protein
MPTRAWAGVLLKQSSATHAKPLKISTAMSSYDLSWTAVCDLRADTLMPNIATPSVACLASPDCKVESSGQEVEEVVSEHANRLIEDLTDPRLG